MNEDRTKHLIENAQHEFEVRELRHDIKHSKLNKADKAVMNTGLAEDNIAWQDGRVLVTHDHKTMPAEFNKFILSKNSSGVLILSQKLSVSDAIEALIFVWEASTAEKWVNQIMSSHSEESEDIG